MQGFMADVKEKVKNGTAKAERKHESAKASAVEKPEKVMAADEAGKEEAHARKHEKEAEAYRVEDEKKAANHAEEVHHKQEAHNKSMENVTVPDASQDNKEGLPTEGNPYVQAPVATAPTSIPHPHLTPEQQNTENAGFPEDQPHQGTKTTLGSDHMTEPIEDQPYQGTKTALPQGSPPEQTNTSRFE